ncbi:MAG: dihydroneopterin aldolase [Actinomycetota bacterium]
MTTARLFLSGIKASGHHGARPGEKDDAQDFVVDLDLEVDVGTDSIDATADYRGVTDAVRAVVSDGSFDLIEAMAGAIAQRVLALDHVARVTAIVHKPYAAERLQIDGVAAAVTAGAGSGRGS